MSSQSQKSQALLSLWRHLVLTSIAKQTHTDRQTDTHTLSHTHTHTHSHTHTHTHTHTDRQTDRQTHTHTHTHTLTHSHTHTLTHSHTHTDTHTHTHNVKGHHALHCIYRRTQTETEAFSLFVLLSQCKANTHSSYSHDASAQHMLYMGFLVEPDLLYNI